jgi:hypothetical protein
MQWCMEFVNNNKNIPEKRIFSGQAVLAEIAGVVITNNTRPCRPTSLEQLESCFRGLMMVHNVESNQFRMFQAKYAHQARHELRCRRRIFWTSASVILRIHH